MSDFPLNPDDFPSWEEASFDESAKFIVPMYISIRKQGLPSQEAAALTAAFIMQSMPLNPPPIKED